ncbi:AAA family ATPase [Atopococcus tabaci]|uniref:AAA family ATPase n=1 Tax=Atopococcus tabaci TaxID=269774 RepID=UPI0003FADC21|nr:AAA family ATPase [Atopococcus tabaci]
MNVIAEKLRLHRDSLFNQSNFFNDYLDFCTVETEAEISPHSRILTSDNVFDFILNLRALNEGIDQKREELFEEYLDNKYAQFQLKSLQDYETLKKINQARRNTQSRYVRQELMDNVREQSNGESAFRYFIEKMEENGLYLLDEPENSLSPERQLELMQYIEDSARFFGCQFVISTHSPFFLTMRGAKIYDLDADPVDVKKWTELKNVRAYYDFFQQHKEEFER